MFNAIKMDLYRMVKSKSTWIMLLIIGAFMVVLTAGVYSDLKSAKENNSTVQNIQDEGNTNLGISVTGYDDTNSENITVSQLMVANVGSLVLGVFLTIFVVIFVNAENKNGFVKNIAGQTSNRINLIVSKIVAIFIYIVLMFTTAMIALSISSQIFFGHIIMGDMLPLIRFLGMELFLHTAFAMILICIVLVFRNSAISMMLGICLVSGLAGSLYGVIDKFISNNLLNGKSFTLSNYLVTGNMSAVGQGYDEAIFIRAAIVSATFLIGMFITSFYVFKKRDIK